MGTTAGRATEAADGEALRRAVQEARARLGAAPDDEEAAQELLAALDGLVDDALDHGTPERALVAAEEHTQLARRSLARAPKDAGRLRSLSLSLRTLGDVCGGDQEGD